ncbi:MAG: SAVED domain-containing protein, partial [Anaerolineaceae bacterium]
MSITNIPEPIKYLLWGKAAGRCEFDGCNKELWQDAFTKNEFNISYIAHIIADKPKGPRGDPILSDKLKYDISNLMLLCDAHHRLIDKKEVAQYSVDKLVNMKNKHEERISRATDMIHCKNSHVLLYGANIGNQISSVSFQKAKDAMFPDWYPAEANPISIGLGNSVFTDNTKEYWSIQEHQLRTAFQQQVQSRIALGQIEHLSVFALAPQPLLIILGTLISDLNYAEVYQPHREPQNWNWREPVPNEGYIIKEPKHKNGEIALV